MEKRTNRPTSPVFHSKQEYEAVNDFFGLTMNGGMFSFLMVFEAGKIRFIREFFERNNFLELSEHIIYLFTEICGPDLSDLPYQERDGILKRLMKKHRFHSRFSDAGRLLNLYFNPIFELLQDNAPMEDNERK
jgi:hypothetical protein